MFRVPASPNAYVYECGCANLKCIKLRSCRGVDPYFSDVAVRQAEQEGGGYIFCHSITHRSLRTECGASFLFTFFCGVVAVVQLVLGIGSKRTLDQDHMEMCVEHWIWSLDRLLH